MFYFNFSNNDYISQNPVYNIGVSSSCGNAINFFTPSENMTDNKNINELNRDYIERLSLKNTYFINLLLHSDFEDGMKNPAIIFVEQNMTNNVFATYLWLSNLYNSYLNISDFDQQRNIILSGILRIFSYVSGNSYLQTIKSTLLGLIKLALSDNDLSVKEAGVMLIEELRDSESLELLKSFDFSNTVINKYTDKVINELEKELSINNKVAV